MVGMRVWDVVTYRLDIAIRKFTDQVTHGFNVVVHPTQQNTLVPNHDTPPHQLRRRLPRNPRKLPLMIKMRVQRHLLPAFPPPLTQPHKFIRPRIPSIQRPTRRHTQPLRRNPKPPNMRNIQ